MKRILFLFLTLNLGISYAQTGGTVALEANPKWFLGMDMGGTWMQSDLKKDYAGMGFSFQFGHYFYRKPARFFDAAWRFRYLHGTTFGFDETRTDISQNSRFNGTFPEYSSLDYTNDTVNNGYIFQNYRMEFNRYALELLIGFNSLRERTGIVLNLFGGIGFTQHQSKMDQLNETGGRYDYSNLDTAGAVSLSDLNDVHGGTPRDLDYESYVPGYSGSSLKVLPSVGFELGYQFGRYFAMGVGHKVTFTLRDDMDGMVATTGRQTFNDRYHYSNLYFKFYIGGGGGGSHHTTHTTHHTTTTTNTTTTNNTPPPAQNKPVIHITNPAACPATVQNAMATIKANIYYVNSANQIVFKVNGNVTGGFNYSASTQQFTSAPLTLLPGDNIIEIKATNEAGSDYQSCVINYQTTLSNPINPPGYPPVITVHNPPHSPYTTSTSNINIVATILNIDNASQISYRVNGVLTSGFFFDPSNGSFSSAIGLNEGANSVEIKATNLYGQDKEILTINYTKPVTIQPPVVTIYNPAINPHTVTVNSGTVNATVLNVASASNIIVTVNGINYTGFTFNPSTHQLVLTTPLITGANVVQITGTNAAGSDSKNTTIIYQPVQNNLPPVVTYTDPITNPYSTIVNTKLIKATVTNVSAASGISVKLNGSAVSGFSFVNTTGEVTFTASLINGANVVEIKGTNPYGSDSKSTVIIYNKVNTGLPPVVAINYPMSNPYNTTVSNETVSATVLNVAGASNINVTVNGTATTAFTYNAATKVLTLPLTLSTGTTTVTVKATNAFGTDSKTTALVYSVPCNIPTITPVNPSTSSYTTGISPFNFIAYSTNITSASQIEFTFNGVTTPFIFDASTG
ncbi:MAG TPA: hypothetical protein VD905_17235, partial [Flavobacteriales bacterium]|nr:hypothetical protein [Flavobacteriales bacterium]